MKFTQYFQFRRTLPDRVAITDAWIQSVLESPLKSLRQEDGRLRLWGRVNEAGGQILRVILLEDGETVHNAFFDRDFKE